MRYADCQPKRPLVPYSAYMVSGKRDSGSWLICTANCIELEKNQELCIIKVIRKRSIRKEANKMFVGREEQLNKIRKIMRKKGMGTILIYGRRRVGKSELIKEVLRNSEMKSIYYECKQVAEESNTFSLGELLSEQFHLPQLGYTRIEGILEYLFKMSITEEMIVVLDEYPYLRENVKGMDSILQSLIDKYRDEAKIKFVILGSYVGVMKSLTEHSNPLYGRMDLVLDLKQMDYRESALFYPNFSDEDKVRIYSVFGGIPYFNRLIDDTVSVRDNVIELIASPGARLENEVSMYLNAEISKLVNANEVFETLAKGYSKYSDILSQSHVSSGPTLIDVLERLMKMEVVTKIAPINDPGNKKKMGYYICDNLSLFYYRYVFRYSSQMKIMNPEIFYNKYIHTDFEEKFVPRQFENICKQYLVEKNRKGEISPVFEKIGKYYYDDPVNKKNGEFDIVTEDENGYVFYEVKFRKDPISDSMIKKEIEQVKATGFNCYKYVFISRSGFQGQETEETRFITIQDLYR